MSVREHRDQAGVGRDDLLEHVEAGEVAGHRAVSAVHHHRHAGLGQAAPRRVEQGSNPPTCTCTLTQRAPASSAAGR
jgi:hypothetical protein